MVRGSNPLGPVTLHGFWGFGGVKLDKMKHKLVPLHVLLSEEEKEEVLKKYNISEEKLPKLRTEDPCAIQLNAKSGDVVRIERKSPTIGMSIAYRLVIEG